MGKFKTFYDKLQEEKLLDAKNLKNIDKSVSKPQQNTVVKELMKKENEEVSTDVLNKADVKPSPDGFFKPEQYDKFPVAKPLFNGIQKRKTLSVDNSDSIDETVNHTTSVPTSYPTGLINFGTKRLITNPTDDIVNDSYGYDVMINPKNNLFSFVKEPTLFQMSEKGVMRFENKWDEKSIKKVIGEKDKQVETKIYDMITYIQGLTKKEQEMCLEYLKYFTDYNLFWKFYEQKDSMDKNSSDFESKSESLQKMMDKLRHKPPTEEEDSDAFYFLNGYYDTLGKMNGGYTIKDANKIREVFGKINVTRMTYFYPTLIDVIRIYDECETSIREFPTSLIDTVDKHDEHPEEYGINESLYYDIMNSNHYPRTEDGKPDKSKMKVKFDIANPKRTQIIDGDLGKDPGDIVYEFVSTWDNNWNRITDKGILIGYGKDTNMTSIDIQTCYFLSYNDFPYVLSNSPRYNTKYHDVKSIPLSMLKVGLQNLVNGYVAADHKDALVKRSGKRRFF